MSLAMKPLLPPPPEAFGPESSHEPAAPRMELARSSMPALEAPVTIHAIDKAVDDVLVETPAAVETDPMADALRDVLATAEPSLAQAVRDFVASQPAAVEAEVPSDRRETVELEPVAKVEPVAEGSDTTASVIVSFDDEPVAATEPIAATEPVAASEPASTPPRPSLRALHEDTVAVERGVVPLRFPRLSSAFIPVRDAIKARSLPIGSLSIAAISLCVAGAALIYARGAVADGDSTTTHAAPAATTPTTASAVVTPIESATIKTPAAAPAACSITVRASSAGATVVVDGKARGLAPQTIPTACNTTAVVEVHHPRYADFKAEQMIDGDVELSAKLERDTTALTVTSDPPGATVTYDGHALGTTPFTTTVNRFEVRKLEFSAPGYQTDWRQIVPKRATKTIAIRLQRRP